MQFGLLPRLMWPLTVYEVPITKVEKRGRSVSFYIKKWLGLPRCLSNIGLYGHGALELPVSGLTEQYKCTKVRLDKLQHHGDTSSLAAKPACLRAAKPGGTIRSYGNWRSYWKKGELPPMPSLPVCFDSQAPPPL